MKTWSLAGVMDVLKHIERITRPPRRSKPIPSPHCDCGLADDMGDLDQHSCVCTIWDDTPNPTEPSLSNDELVGVRGLLQERYEDSPPTVGEWRFTADELDLMGLKPGDRLGSGVVGQPINSAHTTFQTSASVKSTPGTGAEPASPAAPSTAGDSGEAVSGHSPRPDPASPRSPWSVLADRMVNHLPSAKAAQFDDAAAEWIGGAVQVISLVLTDHVPHERHLGSGIYCSCGWGKLPLADFTQTGRDWFEWRDHIAPLIANALAPQPKPATPTSPVIQCHCGIHPYIIRTDVDTTRYICPDHGLVAHSTTK